MKTKRTITLEDNTTVEISDESYAAMVDAAREPVGEALLRSLPFGKYRINGNFVWIEKTIIGDKGFFKKDEISCHSRIINVDDVWSFKEDFERYIGMKVADLRQHHIRPYTVEWRDMTREEVLAFLAHYDGKIVVTVIGSPANWQNRSFFATCSDCSSAVEFAHIERDGTIGEPHKFRCTVDAPHKVEGTDYEF